MTPTDRDRGRDLDALLEALTAVPGLSGHESDMADCLTEQLGPLVDSHWRDPMGNWLGRRAPRPAPATGAAPAPRLLLSAHMDAIGGIPPVGHAREMFVVIDEDLFEIRDLWAAAGHPNSLFPLTADDLAAMTGGRVTNIR